MYFVYTSPFCCIIITSKVQLAGISGSTIFSYPVNNMLLFRHSEKKHFKKSSLSALLPVSMMGAGGLSTVQHTVLSSMHRACFTLSRCHSISRSPGLTVRCQSRTVKGGTDGMNRRNGPPDGDANTTSTSGRDDLPLASKAKRIFQPNAPEDVEASNAKERFWSSLALLMAGVSKKPVSACIKEKKDVLQSLWQHAKPHCLPVFLRSVMPTCRIAQAILIGERITGEGAVARLQLTSDEAQPLLILFIVGLVAAAVRPPPQGRYAGCNLVQHGCVLVANIPF